MPGSGHVRSSRRVPALRIEAEPAKYGTALIATGAASLLYLLGGPPDVDSDIRYFAFALAILVTSLLGGLGPGLLATGLSAFASAYLLLPPVFSIDVASPERAARLILFGAEGILLSLVASFFRDVDSREIEKSRVKAYLPALMIVATATGLKLLVFRDLERALPFAFFYAAIAASAWLGGLGPGLAATLMSSLAARYFFIVPRHSFSVTSPVNAAADRYFSLPRASSSPRSERTIQKLGALQAMRWTWRTSTWSACEGAKKTCVRFIVLPGM